MTGNQRTGNQRTGEPIRRGPMETGTAARRTNRRQMLLRLAATSAAVKLGIPGLGFSGLGRQGEGTAWGATPLAVDLVHKPLPRLQPGIVIGEQQQFGYSNLLTLVLPRLASGDVDSLPEFARRYANMFKMTILANVVQRQNGAETAYLLDKIGVGFAMDINGKLTVVTKDTANELGANLGMIDRGVLAGNEDCLADVIQIARTDRLVIFDATAYLLVDGEHQSRVLRHLVWASPASGQLGFLVWQLKEQDSEQYGIDSPSMQLLPAGFQEDRRIHVSPGNFLSSKIPTPDRFALESIPQGTPVPFSDRMKRVAGRKIMTPSDLEHLLAGTAESLAMLNVPAVAQKP